MRLLILVHRYTGLLISLIIVLWCLSGIVMMYVQYPQYTRTQQLLDLEPLELSRCCVLPDDWSEDFSISAAQVEMFLGDPVLRVSARQGRWSINLATGIMIEGIDEGRARAVAERASGSPVTYRGLIERDQWTVAGGYDIHRPLHHFAVQDNANTELYVSAATGQLVLRTTGTERFWNWLGAVIHWLYPTELRRHVGAWSQTVICLSIAGTILTLTGIYVGIARYRLGAGSPYRGWFLWHHIAGLIFGVFTLTWIVSGLLSMTPFGALSGRDFSSERNNIRGGDLNFGHVAASLSSMDMSQVDGGSVRLTSSMFAGEFAWIARSSADDAGRMGIPLDDDLLRSHAVKARPLALVESVDVIIKPDAYYYSHHEVRTFPVLRIEYEDGERLYLDTVSGELLSAVDSDRRWSRWLFSRIAPWRFRCLGPSAAGLGYLHADSDGRCHVRVGDGRLSWLDANGSLGQANFLIPAYW